jgi:aldehyde:ferredoxin oxidoreductase
VNAVTGAGYTLEELTTAGERILNAERLFMARAGFDRGNDTLPIRLLREPQAEGPSKDKVVELEKMLDEYYESWGWTAQGIPTAAKLAELGLPPLAGC